MAHDPDSVERAMHKTRKTFYDVSRQNEERHSKYIACIAQNKTRWNDTESPCYEMRILMVGYQEEMARLRSEYCELAGNDLIL